MAVKVLGPLDTGAVVLSPRERAIFSALIVRLGSAVSVAELAEAYWGDAVPTTWNAQVKNAIARIRARLGPATVETLGAQYRLRVDPESIDAVRFERLVSAARAHALRGEHDRAIDAYRRALALWAGAPYVDIAGWQPAQIEAMRLSEIRRSAEDELLDVRLRAGEHRSVISDAERLVQEEPLREDRWALLALAQYRADRQADALAVLRAARERLAAELGIEPGARLAALEVSILRHDPALDAPVPSLTVAETCPYPGLRAFGPNDADVFFGREADVEAVLEMSGPGAVVTLAGASGTGKSSLLLAGVLPRLQARGLAVAVVRPATGGVDAVRRALEHARVLAVDQAEELLTRSDADIAAFGRLAGVFVDGGGAILTTARSDALDRLRAIPEIGDRLGRGIYLLGALTDAAYRSAIEEPAHVAGLQLEAGLVELAVRDAGDRASTLPHLSHALQETWARREGATLTVDGYRQSGGIPGAIAQSAEDAFRSLDPADQSVCRSLMLRLIDRGADGTSTRRHVAAGPLLSDAGRRRVLERLTQARLVTLDDDAVVIAHEAVATAWPRLDAWLEEDAEGRRTLQAVEAAAGVWEGGGRDDDDLLRGARLHRALAWQEVAQPDLTAVERAFLDASANRERDELTVLTRAATRDRRRTRVLGAALGVAAALLVAVVVAGSIAVVRAREAAAAAEDARIEALVASSLAVPQSDRELAALLAAEAYRRWPGDARVRSALWGAITAAQGLVDTHRPAHATIAAMAVIPGTGTALRVADDAEGTTIEIVDPSSGVALRSFDVELPPPPTQWYRDLAVSRDGAVAAIQTGRFIDPDDTGSCCWNEVTFVDLASGEVLPGSQLLKMRTSPAIDLGEDGSVAYLQQPVTGDVIAVDTRSGRVQASNERAFEDHTGREGLHGAVAVVDGARVATSTGESIEIFDRASLSPLASIPLDHERRALALVADGTGSLVVAFADHLARVRIDTGAVQWRRSLDDVHACYRLVVTPRSSVACSSYLGVTEIELATGMPTGTGIDLQLDTVSEIGLLDDATVLISSTFNGFWARWRIDGSGAGSRVVAAGDVVTGGPDREGNAVAAMPVDGGAARLWDLESDAAGGTEADSLTLLGGGVVSRWDRGLGTRLENTLTGEVYPYRLAGLPDLFEPIPGGWGRLAFAFFGGQVVAFDPATGEAVGQPMAVPRWRVDEIASVSTTPDETKVALTWWDAAANVAETAVFDLGSGELLARGLPDVYETLIVGPDELIAVTDETVHRVDLGTLEPTSSLARATGASQAMDVSLDGRTLLNVGWNNRLTLYDLTRDIVLGEPVAAAARGVRGGYLTADGETLVMALPDGILLWDLVPAHQAVAACQLAGRELSAQEWSTYFPGEQRVATCAQLAE